MGDQTQAYDIFQTPLSSGYPLPLNSTVLSELLVKQLLYLYNCHKLSRGCSDTQTNSQAGRMIPTFVSQKMVINLTLPYTIKIILLLFLLRSNRFQDHEFIFCIFYLSSLFLLSSPVFILYLFYYFF
jgi:hypothetical protein